MFLAILLGGGLGGSNTGLDNQIKNSKVVWYISTFDEELVNPKTFLENQKEMVK